MAKARAATITIEGDDEDKAAQEAADFDEANMDEGGELFRITDEIRGTAGVKLQIVRTWPNTPELSGHVGDLTPAEFSVDRIRELYGVGRYRVRLVGPKGFLKGGGAVHIARAHADAPAGTAGGAGADLATLLKLMTERDEASRRERSERQGKWMELAIPGALTCLAAVLGRSPPAGPDIASLVLALKPAPGPSITDLTTSLSNLKTLTDVPKGDDSKLDTILKVMEFAKTMSGGDGDKGGGDSNWIDVIRDLLREGPAMVKPLLENLQAQQQTRAMQVHPVQNVTGQPALMPAPGISVTPNATVSAQPNTTGEPDSTGDDMMTLYMPMIRAQLAKLVQWATENKRVDLYAEVFLEELPAIVHERIKPAQALEALQRADAIAIVLQYEPRLAVHSEWLSAMITELIDILTDQIKDEEKAARRAAKEVPAQMVDSLNGENTGE